VRAAAGGSELFSVNVSHLDAKSVVYAAGELDAATVGALAHALAMEVDSGVAVLYLDLSELSFIGAAGVNALLTAHRAMASEGRTFIIRYPGAFAMRVFAACGVSKSLNFELEPLGR
jgi:anti-anti-sigma factor